MSDAANPAQSAAKMVTELKASAHIMSLDEGVYCFSQQPPTVGAAGVLPGIRLSLPPGPAARPEAVRIAGFRADGWLTAGEAALVHVDGGPGHLLVTIYQASDAAAAPRLQVTRLFGSAAPAETAPTVAAAEPEAPVVSQPPRQPPVAGGVADLLAHVQSHGDVGGRLGQWLGEPGSKLWVEGFAIAPVSAIPASDIEYQAVLGRGWLSPWVEGGQYCGSRGMALPILGLKVRLRGASADTHECRVTASFVDGSRIGPVGAGEACEAESLSPVEALMVEIVPRGQVTGGAAKGAKATKPRAR